MEIQPNKLLVDIERCREEMIDLAINSSFSNKRVVDLSTKLDVLLNRYYMLTEKK
ncbi:Spo0E family sporulation regulatory protein-aspartic acid phosphatase [Neobacillus sp. D3-1R]|uniref:Spo0E family sporulation regulatory protein-aspartic acid phosphatase n=1 Tax=Neobacillus sp. D3-1R TaxID=3445778 RepID=UPI003F9FEBE9